MHLRQEGQNGIRVCQVVIDEQFVVKEELEEDEVFAVLIKQNSRPLHGLSALICVFGQINDLTPAWVDFEIALEESAPAKERKAVEKKKLLAFVSGLCLFGQLSCRLPFAHKFSIAKQ
jgi:hypothetical protein